MYGRIFKRLIDMAIAGLLLVLFSPLMAAAAVSIWLSMGRPILFAHRRPGLREKPFLLYKFRTMLPPVNQRGEVPAEHDRITLTGRLLRLSSIDELPQLWNILRGDMSLIGPRPLLEAYLPYYTETERRRHLVRPGLTGLAQINGRNTLGADERLAMDVEYVETLSFGADLAIFLKTPWAILSRDGVQLSPADAGLDFIAQREPRRSKVS